MCTTLKYFRYKINNKMSYNKSLSLTPAPYSPTFLFLLSTHPNRNHS